LPRRALASAKSRDDREAARAELHTVAHPPQPEHTPEFHIVVSPAKGTFHPRVDVSEGDHVAAGTQLGVITTNRDERPVAAGASGILAEWLRHEGDIVGAGLPVARLHFGSGVEA